jgi:hypothetical protein
MGIERLKLLVEEPTYEYDVLLDEKNSKETSTMYIRGPYLMGEQKNKNGRIYTMQEMVPEVNRYISEMITENRSLGELNHPVSVEVNPERSCHMITELKRDNTVYIGKSKVLSNPIGQVVRSLIMDGVKLGISSRALGKLIPGTNGTHQVQGFHLICCDVVHDPSVNAGQGGPQAFINGILEAKEWILEKDGTITEAYETFERKLAKLPTKQTAKEEVLKEAVLKFLKTLRNPQKN